MSPLAHSVLGALPANALLLDCGGWFNPLNRATHVVDLMPYETRGSRLQVEPLPGECFTRETWTQIDFLLPDFRLPFADHYFDYAYCSHTIEDLASPFRLLEELVRVSRKGLLVAPSRLAEQTTGHRDRMTNRRGHPHHHWIIDTHLGYPRFAAKPPSLTNWWRSSIPLHLSEKIRQSDPLAAEWIFQWEDSLKWKITSATEAASLANAFATASGATTSQLLVDLCIRTVRRLKYIRREDNNITTRQGWAEIVALSQPYSRIPLS